MRIWTRAKWRDSHPRARLLPPILLPQFRLPDNRIHPHFQKETKLIDRCKTLEKDLEASRSRCADLKENEGGRGKSASGRGNARSWSLGFRCSKRRNHAPVAGRRKELSTKSSASATRKAEKCNAVGRQGFYFLICGESWPRYRNLEEGKKSLTRIPFSSTSSLRQKIQIENMALGSNGVGAIKDSEAPGVVSGVKNTSKSGQYQLPDRRMIAEASLDKKLTFLWDACQNIRKKEKDSEKAILDLASEIESLKADNTKLLAKIKNANIRSASLDGVLNVVEDKEASGLTSQTSEPVNNEEMARVLEIQIRWVKKELLMFKNDDQFLMGLKTYWLQKINSKEVEDCKLSLDEDEDSEEIKTLKEKENELQKTLIRLQTEIGQVLGVLVVTQYENKKIEQIINFLKENNEVLNTVSLVRRSAEVNNCSRDREQVKIMVETLDQELSELESAIEAGFLQFGQICESFGS